MKIEYQLLLKSDAEPGTGLGGERADDFVPRTSDGRPRVPASHLKGLLREFVSEMGHFLGQPHLASDLLGSSGTSVDDEARAKLSDAEATDTTARMINRTALDQNGTAKAHSLRTTEAIPAGAVLKGQVHLDAAPGSRLDLALRVALLALGAVGSGRNRGAGTCVVTIEDEKRSIAELLEALEAVEEPSAEEGGESAATPSSAEVVDLDENRIAVLRLIFQAGQPVCCPETPGVSLNVIKTGFMIPSSAVQGAVLHRLNRRSEALATACFNSPAFRAWPLLPCGEPDGNPGDKHLVEGIPVRAPVTHKIAKGARPGPLGEKAQDSSIRAFDGDADKGGAPLKAVAGVLLWQEGGGCRFWGSSDMKRVISAHAVHHDPDSETGRNLFSVESMAPMVWSGLLVLPEAAEAEFRASLDEDPTVFFGKGRGVRGRGQLRVESLDEDKVPEWGFEVEGDAGSKTVLVAQSPLVLEEAETDGQRRDSRDDQPSDPLKVQAEKLFSDWASRHELPKPAGIWPVSGIRFGWTRVHGRGRIGARRVLLPGTVVAFGEVLPPQKLRRALLAGVGAGRREGFGALSTHPGKGTDLRPAEPNLDEIGSTHVEARKRAFEILQKNRSLPSANQLATLVTRVQREGPAKASEYLKHQHKDGRLPIWRAWDPIYSDVQDLLQRHDEQAAGAALQMLLDSAVSARRER